MVTSLMKFCDSFLAVDCDVNLCMELLFMVFQSYILVPVPRFSSILVPVKDPVHRLETPNSL